jgi:NAD(P)-dependent dehydrogenase (short-subunit alcohol dehydrogenase family)
MLTSALTTVGGVVDTVLDRTVAPGYSRVGLAVRRRLPGWPADPEPGALQGRAVAVTGPTSGLGTATAEGVAALGGDVHLVVRDVEKGERLAADLRRRHPRAAVAVWRCDVGDLDDVRRFARELVGSGARLDALVHNAGSMPPERTLSPQGHELTMAVHVLGPVVMTEELLPALRPGARVVLVKSGGMYAQPLPVDDPQYLRGDYAPATAYARSKRAQVELLPVLQERWGRHGVSVHATHPGWADTPGVQTSLPTFRRLTGPVLRDAQGGADTTVWLLAVRPTPEPGGLWHDRRRRPTSLLRRTRPTAGQRERFWAWTVEAARLDEARAGR